MTNANIQIYNITNLREISKACELSCGKTIIKDLDEVGKQAYGTMLIKAVKLGGCYKKPLASLTLNNCIGKDEKGKRVIIEGSNVLYAICL